MDGFVPGQPILSKEQQEQVILNTFGIREPVQQQAPVQGEEVVQLTKAEYERLMAGNQVQEQTPVEQEVKTEVEPVADPLTEIDRIFGFLQPASEKEAEVVVEKEVAQEVKQPTAFELQTAEISRLKDETTNFYSKVGELAEKEYGMNQKEAISLVMGLTTEQLAQIAYVLKGVNAGVTANELVQSRKPQAPKSIASMSNATVPTNSAEQQYVPKRNPFTY
jgi:hypothetical protein